MRQPPARSRTSRRIELSMPDVEEKSVRAIACVPAVSRHAARMAWSSGESDGVHATKDLRCDEIIEWITPLATHTN